MLRAIQSDRLTRWGERLSLRSWAHVVRFLLPVRIPSCLHPVFLHSFPSYQRGVEDGLEEVVGEGQSVHRELRFSISMQPLHFIQLKSGELFFPGLRTTIRCGDSVSISALCPNLWTSLYKVVCVYSYFTLSTTEHYFFLSLIHPCLSSPTDFENGSVLLSSSHTWDMFLCVCDLQACDLPRVAKKLIISSHHFLLGYNSHQRTLAFLWTYWKPKTKKYEPVHGIVGLNPVTSK